MSLFFHIAAQPVAVATYDQLVGAFGNSVISYWKFENDGTDEKGAQNAVITGSPETGVETIVDSDTGGECIAWPGSAGVYAQCNAAAAHSTAEGTIFVSFQADSVTAKKILLTADDVAASSVGVAIEYESNGALTGFVRTGPSTVARVTGGVGDVSAGQAYTAVLKWGAAGLSLALWSEGTVEVWRGTDAATNGMAGYAAAGGTVTFGAYHTDVAHHDGPFSRVVWLDRRISDAEEQILALPLTIVRGSLPLEPPAGTTVWVASGGSASWPGTESVPMGNIAAAIRGSSAGDIIAVKGGAGIYTESGETLSSEGGSAGNPIQVVGYGTAEPEIDNCYQQFRGGSPGSPLSVWSLQDAGKNIWISSGVSVSGVGGQHGFGPDGDGVPAGQRLRLLGYANVTSFEATTTTADSNAYWGPGLYLSGSDVRIRTETARWSSELGHGSFPTNKNPNEQDIVVFGPASQYTLSDCSHITFKHIKWLYARFNITLTNATNNIKFEHCQFEGKEDNVRIGRFTSFIDFDYCKLHMNVPNYLPWRAWKNNQISNYNGRTNITTSNQSASATEFATDINIRNCEFFGCLIPVALWDKVVRVKVLNCEFRRLEDDGVSIGQTNYDIEIAYCHSHDGSGWFIGRVSGSGAQDNPGDVWAHHNLIEIEPYYYESVRGGTADTEPGPFAADAAMSTNAFVLGHGGINDVSYISFYHNTIIAAWDQDRIWGIGHEYLEGWPQGAQTFDTVARHFNNIFVQQSSFWKFYSDVRFYEDNVADGNCYWRPISQSTDFATSVLMSNGSTRKDYADLAAMQADGDLGATALYAPGFEPSGVQLNPGFVGGGTSTYGSYLFASASDYLPTHASVIAGAVDMRGFGMPGVQDTVYQAWRGALDPNGDGSEVGVQPG